MDEVKLQLDAAQRAADEAEEKLALERQRVEKVQQELQALDEQLRLADPDDEKAFSRIVVAQAAARARAEALQARMTEAERVVEAAQAGLVEAKAAAAQAEWREVAARREQRSGEIVAEVKTIVGELSSLLQAHHEDTRSDATRELERAAGETLPTTIADRFTDPAHAVATVIAMLREEAANAAWLASDGPRRQEEALRREQERTAQRIVEATFEGNLDQVPSRVRQTALGGDHADA